MTELSIFDVEKDKRLNTEKLEATIENRQNSTNLKFSILTTLILLILFLTSIFCKLHDKNKDSITIVNVEVEKAPKIQTLLNTTHQQEIKNLKKRSINEKSSLISKSGFQNQTGRSVGGRDEVNIKHMESIHENKKDSHKKNDVKKPKPRNLQNEEHDLPHHETEHKNNLIEEDDHTPTEEHDYNSPQTSAINKNEHTKHTSIHQGDVCGKVGEKYRGKRDIADSQSVKYFNSKPPDNDDRISGNHKVHGRIYNGVKVEIEKYPWQVSLFFNNFLTCGGSILNKNWIVTAAHCTAKRNMTNLWEAYTGASDLKYRGIGKSQKRKIKSMFQHKDYVDDKTYKNDITLMRFDEPLEYSDVAQPICLPEDNEVFQNGRECYVSGWGKLKSTSNDVMFPTTLNHVQVDVIGRDICTRPDWLGSRINNQMICAGKIAGDKDACQGDSGGPLSCYDKNEQVWKLTGIVSWGIGCGLAKKPGVYTNLAYYLPWIRETIQNEENTLLKKQKTKTKNEKFKKEKKKKKARKNTNWSKGRGRGRSSYGKYFKFMKSMKKRKRRRRN